MAWEPRCFCFPFRTFLVLSKKVFWLPTYLYIMFYIILAFRLFLRFNFHAVESNHDIEIVSRQCQGQKVNLRIVCVWRLVEGLTWVTSSWFEVSKTPENFIRTNSIQPSTCQFLDITYQPSPSLKISLSTGCLSLLINLCHISFHLNYSRCFCSPFRVAFIFAF